MQRIVSEDIAAGKRAGVVGTPALFLNGRPVNLVFGGPTFWKAMADAWKHPSDVRQAAMPAATDLSMVVPTGVLEE